MMVTVVLPFDATVKFRKPCCLGMPRELFDGTSKKSV